MITRQTKISFPNNEYADITTGIIADSMDVSEILSDTSNLMFGNISATKFECALITRYNLKGIKIQVTVDTTESGVTTTNYIFTGKILSCVSMDTGIARKIIAYDDYYYLDTTKVFAWYNDLLLTQLSTCTIKQMRESLFTYYNIPFATQNLPNDSLLIGKKITSGDLLFTDIVKAIGQITGTFGKFRRDGTFEFVQLSNATSTDISSNVRTSLEYEDYITDTIDCIQYSQGGEVIAYTGESVTGNVYYIEDNILLLEMSDTQLDSILTTLLDSIDNISYTPAHFEMIISDVSLQVGDYVKIDDSRYTYILQNSFTGIQLTEQLIESNGDRDRSNDGGDSANSTIIINQTETKEHFGIYTQNASGTFTLDTAMTGLISVNISAVAESFLAISFSTEIYNTSATDVLATFSVAIDNVEHNIQEKRVNLVSGYNLISINTFEELTVTGIIDIAVVGKADTPDVCSIAADKSKLVVFGTGLTTKKIETPYRSLSDVLTNPDYTFTVDTFTDSMESTLIIPSTLELADIFPNISVIINTKVFEDSCVITLQVETYNATQEDTGAMLLEDGGQLLFKGG